MATTIQGQMIPDERKTCLADQLQDFDWRSFLVVVVVGGGREGVTSSFFRNNEEEDGLACVGFSP